NTDCFFQIADIQGKSHGRDASDRHRNPDLFQPGETRLSHSNVVVSYRQHRSEKLAGFAGLDLPDHPGFGIGDGDVCSGYDSSGAVLNDTQDRAGTELALAEKKSGPKNYTKERSDPHAVLILYPALHIGCSPIVDRLDRLWFATVGAV